MLQQEEQTQARRAQAETAIQLAMANRWEDAIGVNRAIISVSPNDVDSYNRLGKALMELGRYAEAKKAYKKTLSLDSTNRIAMKNLERLNVLAKTGDVQAETKQVDPAIFIEEMGKSTVTILKNMAEEMLPRSNAGDPVALQPKGTTLTVATLSGEFIGELEPKLGLRLIKLLDGGNKYAAAVASTSGAEFRIIIKETYQDPSQAGRPSFPTAVSSESTRPYTKGRLVRHEGTDTEPATAEGEPSSENGGKEAWEGETERQEGHVRLYDAAAAEEAAEEESEE